MLLRVLGVRPNDLSEAVLQRLIDNRTPESQHLEFKAELPRRKDKDRREFARDVCAIANGGGGVLIFGLSEERGVAAALNPVTLAGQVTRLEQISSQTIHPYLRFRSFQLPIDEGRGLIVLEIPMSPQRPFAVSEGEKLGFYSRNGTHKFSLTEAEVERMYRDRFRGISESLSRLTELRTRAQSASELLPRAFVVATPAIAAHRLFRTDRSTTQAIMPLRDQGNQIFDLDVGEIIPLNTRVAFKRLEMANNFLQEHLQKYGWIEFHDDGAYVGTIPGQLMNSQEGALERGVFYESLLTANVLARLGAYGVLARHFDLSGEVLIRCGISKSPQPIILRQPELLRGRISGNRELAEEIMTELSIDVEELVGGAALLRAGKAILDDLFSAFGWPECLMISEEGHIRQRYVSESYRAHIAHWAAREGIVLTDELAT